MNINEELETHSQAKVSAISGPPADGDVQTGRAGNAWYFNAAKPCAVWNNHTTSQNQMDRYSSRL